MLHKPVVHIRHADGHTSCGKNAACFVKAENAHLLYGDRPIRPCRSCLRVHAAAERQLAIAAYAALKA